MYHVHVLFKIAKFFPITIVIIITIIVVVVVVVVVILKNKTELKTEYFYKTFSKIISVCLPYILLTNL